MLIIAIADRVYHYWRQPHTNYILRQVAYICTSSPRTTQFTFVPSFSQRSPRLAAGISDLQLAPRRSAADPTPLFV